MIHINAKIMDVVRLEDGVQISIRAGTPGRPLLEKRPGDEVEIGIEDGRTITPAQRRKIYATLNDISLHTGYTPDAAKQVMKVEHMLRTECTEYFSLSDCSVTTAREYINTLMEYALREGIVLSGIGLECTDDIDTYLYQCMKYRKCCICGRSADIHHVDAIGMGRDRRTVDDSMMKKAALCRNHHTIAHQMGWKRFSQQYKIYGIVYNDCRGGDLVE
ncbi:MAG: putative HNHc nuclease [Eubacteriales bacterium]|nr:putative HNHc nuclease [Eubacteriales bacterium]